MKSPPNRQRESIPVIDPTALRPPPAGYGETGAKRNNLPQMVLILAFAVLLATAVAVIFFLPHLVAEPPVAISAEDSGTLPAAATDPDKQRAESVLATLQAALVAWQERGLAQWGGAAYLELQRLIKRGEAEYGRRQYSAAAKTYLAAQMQLENLAADLPQHVQTQLDEAVAALNRGDAGAARSHFGLALQMVPEHEGARHGLVRADRIGDVFQRLESAREHERQGKLEAALADYRHAAELDPELEVAASARDRVQAAVTEQRFRRLMSQGLRALSQSEPGAALKAFREARRLKPTDEAAADGVAQAEQGLRLEQISSQRQQAQVLERQERWQAAAERYRAALALDPALSFAREGRRRSEYNAKIHEQLDFYLERPERLFSPEPYQNAQKWLEAAASATPGPLLTAKITRLKRQLQLAWREFPVILESDSETEVTVYRIGMLGKFARHRLLLRPGTYTVVGSRAGYRDVRYTVSVDGREPEIRVRVQCEEKI